MTDDDVLNDRQHLKAGPGFMRQPFKIYENLRSAVSVYRGQASKGVYQVTEADDEDYDSVDSSEASDQAKVEAARGHMTDDSGIDSITVSPTREAGGMMETLLTMAMADEKLEGTGQGEHRSFLHNSSQWQRELLLNNNNSSSNSNVRLTSVSHRREDSDDIRSDTSSDNIAEEEGDSDDTNNSDCPRSRVYQIGVSDLSELSELSELLASTNTVLQRNTNLRASLTISAVKRSLSTVGVTATPRSVRKSVRRQQQTSADNSTKMIGGNDEEELPGHAGRKVAAGDSGGSGETEPGPEKLNGGPEVESHRKQESEPAEKSLDTKDDSSEAQHFVRTYKDRNGCWVGAGGKTSPGMRMSMAIRPQTVANLASKFDSIIKEKQPVSKSNSRQLKLRTYDISKIISELNRLNSGLDSADKASLDSSGDKNCDKPAASKFEEATSGNTRCDGNHTKKTQDSNTIGGDTVRGNGDVSSDICGKARNRRLESNQDETDKKKTVSFLETETTSSLSSEGSLSLRRAGLRSGSGDNDGPESGLTTPRAQAAAAQENKKEVSGGPGSLAGRYLAAVNSGPRPGSGSGVRLTSSGLARPSVRQTRELLLIKTGQAKLANTSDDTATVGALKMARSAANTDNGVFPDLGREERPRHKKTDQSVRENGAKCGTSSGTSSDRNSNVWDKQSSEKRSQSLASCQPAPNNSFLWNKSNRVASEYQNRLNSTIAEEEELYDDVQNCHTYSEIRKRDNYDTVRRSSVSKSTENLAESKRTSQLYMSAENLTYDDVSNVRTEMIAHDDEDLDVSHEDAGVDFHRHADLVTATPAVILEDGALDSLSVIYDDIRRQENNNRSEEDQLTLYESIAGSLLRLDKIEGDEGTETGRRGERPGGTREEGLEVVSYSLAGDTVTAEGMWGSAGTYTWRGDTCHVTHDTCHESSDRSDEWVDIDSDDDYAEGRNLTRHVHFARSSIRASSRRQKVSGSRAGAGVSSWVRAVRDVGGAGDSTEQDSNESIYEIIRPAESESDFEEIPEESDECPDYFGSAPAKISNSNLSKIAEAAGRKMKKLKTNWSIKKSDITRSLSRIKKNPRPALDLGSAPDGGVRRKVSRRLSQNGVRPSVMRRGSVEREVEGDTEDADTMFYITLTIEEDRPGGVTLVPGHGASQDSDVDSNTYSHMSSDSSGSRLVSQRRGRSNYSIVRPGVPPPAPPIRTVTSTMRMSSTDTSEASEASDQGESLTSNTGSHTDSLLLCDSLKEFYVGMGDCDSGLDSTEMEETYTSSLFQTEPLYQFYDEDSDKNNNKSDIIVKSDHKIENVYETVDSLRVLDNNHRKAKVSRSSAMDIVISCTGRRSLWAELPEVIDSGILRTISPETKKLQEAMFEVISSEASYLKSLNILISHFVQSSQFSGDTSVLNKRDQRILFSEVISVRACSEKFLADLESRWQESVVLSDINDIIMKHARTNFHVYVKYCSNQVYQDRTLKRLRIENPAFVEALKELECQEACQGLAMHSFLMLPMQRITRLPLLTDAIASRLPSNSNELQTAKQALNLLSGLVSQCNESARYMERMEEMLILSHQLDFRDVRAIPLISASRWLVRRGDATKLTWKENGEKLTFGRRVHKQSLALFLLTDLLVVTKKKGEERFLVLDYTPRNMVQMTPMDSVDGVPGLDHHNPGFALWLTLLQNHENKTAEMLLSFSSEAERAKWVESVRPSPAVTDASSGETVYEQWDCPKVEMVEGNTDLDLSPGDAASVLRKSNDGWYYIERTCDGLKAWIPSSSCQEVESSHIRAKHFKQRYAFLKALTVDSSA